MLSTNLLCTGEMMGLILQDNSKSVEYPMSLIYEEKDLNGIHELLK